mmetsp:Transcript_52625/g.125310  ORF Transcript_52625/g.125310 Transcript_52625/m.125310 type:complete len:206 (+) Transcript_52625:143-760(+)
MVNPLVGGEPLSVTWSTNRDPPLGMPAIVAATTDAGSVDPWKRSSSVVSMSNPSVAPEPPSVGCCTRGPGRPSAIRGVAAEGAGVPRRGSSAPRYVGSPEWSKTLVSFCAKAFFHAGASASEMNADVFCSPRSSARALETALRAWPTAASPLAAPAAPKMLRSARAPTFPHVLSCRRAGTSFVFRSCVRAPKFPSAAACSRKLVS